MRSILGDGFPAFLKSYERPAEKGIRVNTLKISAEQFEKISPFPLERVPWEPSGFYAPEANGKNIFHAAGLYYMQEPSAMCAAPELEVKAGERVLDLCSAPGGKGTRLAEAMRGEGVIVLNEINFPRAKILSSNVERMGIKNAVVTCAPPEKLAEVFCGYFDKILVDAPCSGEGMFKRNRRQYPSGASPTYNFARGDSRKFSTTRIKCSRAAEEWSILPALSRPKRTRNRSKIS